MFRRLNQRNQITIPPKVLEGVNAEEGDLFEIRCERGKIILVPKRLEDKEGPTNSWAALKDLVREQEIAGDYTEYRSPKAAKKHLRTLR